MGLADLVKRKLGSASLNGNIQERHPGTDVIPEKLPSSSEIAALKEKGTRTARRKLRKIEPALLSKAGHHPDRHAIESETDSEENDALLNIGDSKTQPQSACTNAACSWRRWSL